MTRPTAAAAMMAIMVGAVLAGPVRGDETTEVRLREALRAQVAETRALEDERVRLQAKISENERIIAALKAQQSQPAPGSGAAAGGIDRAVVDRLEAEFNRRLSEQNEALGKAAAVLDKWKAAYQEAAATARTKETERAKAADALAAVGQRAESCEAKNVALYQVGSEILGRYAAMDLEDALSDKEPFLGIKRVELQTLVQDYQDKLIDQKAKP